MTIDDHTKPDAPYPKRSLSPSGMPRVFAPVTPEQEAEHPKMLDADDDDSTWGQIPRPPLHVDSLRPDGDNGLHWQVWRTVEGLCLDIKRLVHRSEERSRTATEMLEARNAQEHLTIQADVAKIRETVGGRVHRFVAFSSATALLIGALTGLVVAISQIAKCESEQQPHRALDRMPGRAELAGGRATR